jgi:hypothetical protein
MTEPTSAQELFKGRHFDQEIIVLCVRWYLTFKLSSRDLVQMMAERGIILTRTTILRWVTARDASFHLSRAMLLAPPIVARLGLFRGWRGSARESVNQDTSLRQPSQPSRLHLWP